MVDILARSSRLRSGTRRQIFEVTTANAECRSSQLLSLAIASLLQLRLKSHVAYDPSQAQWSSSSDVSVTKGRSFCHMRGARSRAASPRTTPSPPTEPRGKEVRLLIRHDESHHGRLARIGSRNPPSCGLRLVEHAQSIFWALPSWPSEPAQKPIASCSRLRSRSNCLMVVPRLTTSSRARHTRVGWE